MKEFMFRYWNVQRKQFCKINFIGNKEEQLCVIPMLYTGIKDCCNVQIYEGDIIKYLNFYFDAPKMHKTPKNIGIVKFGVGKVSVSGFDEGFVYVKGFYIKRIYGEERGVPPSLLEMDYIKIIGNEFENPKLVEKYNKML